MASLCLLPLRGARRENARIDSSLEKARFLLPARLQALLLPEEATLRPFFGQEPRPGLGKRTPARRTGALPGAGGPAAGPASPGDLPGLQLINVAAGEPLSRTWPAGNTQHWAGPRQFPWHTVRVLGHTRLGDLLGEGFLAVNSFHHQAVERPAPGFRVSAVAADGVVEALESCRHRFVLAVQWHPEALDHPASHRLFQALVAAARELFQP